MAILELVWSSRMIVTVRESVGIAFCFAGDADEAGKLNSELFLCLLSESASSEHGGSPHRWLASLISSKQQDPTPLG